MNKKMKRGLIFVLVFMLLCNSVLFGRNVQTVHAENETTNTNIIVNGDFESGTVMESAVSLTDSQKAGIGDSKWNGNVTTGITYQIIQDSSDTANSSKVMKVLYDATLSTAEKLNGTIKQACSSKLEAGVEYVIKVRAKAVNAGKNAKLRFNLNNTELSAGDLLAQKCSNEWVEHTYKHTFETIEKHQLDVKMYNIEPNGYWLIDDISIEKVQPTEPTITVSPTTLSLEEEKTGELTATLTDEDGVLGATPTYEWTSSDTTVATVTGNGATATVTAVKATADPVTITVKAKNADASKSVSATCTVTVTAAQTEESVVSVNGVEYTGTLQEAIAAAPASSVIKLLKNAETESVNTETYFTLDLNGYTLKLSSFGKYVNVVDSVGGGLLEVAADACTLPPTNEQMPVYDGTKNGYVFVTIKDQNDGGTISENSFKLIFRPSFGIDGTAKNTLLASGGKAAGISIGLRLYWTEDSAPKSQVLVYGEDMVATVYSPNKKAFYINAIGTDNFTELKVAPYIESATGVVWNGTPIPVNSAN